MKTFAREILYLAAYACSAYLSGILRLLKVIRNDDAASQHFCYIVSNGYNIVPTFQRCVNCAKNRRCESSAVRST